MKLTTLKIAIALGVVTILFVGFLIFWGNREIPVNTNQNPSPSDYKSLTFMIENQAVTFRNGYSEVEAAPGSTSKIITKYFGNEAFDDLNGDGAEDVAFLLTQETGGSGTFYYLAAALKTSTGYQPTSTVFLGDRIAPQTTQISSGAVTVNYADRKPGEPVTATPSIGISRYFKVEGINLVEQMDTVEFGKPTDLVVNQKIKFSDGLIVSLKEINDSRCKPGVICIWAGELSPLLIVTGGEIDKDLLEQASQELRLGTTTNKKVTKSGYVFELKSATESTATIIITKDPKNLGVCYITGCSSEICSDRQDIASICIYKKEYACYKTATCERQASGQCGWTQTSELVACLHSK